MVWDAEPSPRQGTGQVTRVPAGHYAPLARDARFQLLRTRFQRLALTITVLFLGWYFLYVALSAFARDLMARTVAGNVNVAILLGVLQFASTFLLAAFYSVYARRALDPLSAGLRAEAEVVPPLPRRPPEQEPVPRQAPAPGRESAPRPAPSPSRDRGRRRSSSGGTAGRAAGSGPTWEG